MYICNKVSNIITKMLVILLISITGYLFIVSIFSTVYVSEYENIYYIKDNYILNFILIIISLIFTITLKDKIKKLIIGNENKMVVFNSIILSIILLFIVLSTRLYPLYDQAKIINVIKNMWTYNYSDFLPGGYIDKCDNQKGITLYFYLITKVFGKISITAIQLINSLYIVISNIVIYKTVSIVFNKKYSALIHLALCLYAPQWLYATFIYGIIPSHFFGILSIYYFVKLVYENDVKSKNIKHLILTGLFLNISILLKTNSVIILIALIALSIYFIIINTDRKKYIFNICIIVVLYLFSTKVVNNYYVSNTGLRSDSGIPRTAHIAMALIDNSDKGPGWYNGYTAELYEKNNYDKKNTNEEALIDIKESLDKLKSNPSTLISFISRKIVSQWNEPTFESLYILYGRDSLVEMPDFFIQLTNPTSRLNWTVRLIFNIIQLFVLFGSLSYYVLKFKEISINELIYSVVIIGGFLFHIIWEAKSQYIIIYFLMLIPYGVIGFITLSNEIHKSIKNIKSEQLSINVKNNKTIYLYSGIVVFTIIIISVLPYEGVFGKLFKPSWKTEEYKMVTSEEYNNYEPAKKLDEDYINSLVLPKLNIRNKNCYICLSDNENYVLSENNNNEIGFYETKDNQIDRSVLLFNNSTGKTTIRFKSSQKVLDVSNGRIIDGNPLQQWEYNGDKGQQFEIAKINDSDYIITNNGLALGVDKDGRIILTKQEEATTVRIK